MRKHPFDLASLLAGLVFVGFAAVYLVAAATGNDLDASWVLPIGLVALGLAGLAGGLTRAVRKPAEPVSVSVPAEGATTEPEAGTTDVATQETTDPN